MEAIRTDVLIIGAGPVGLFTVFEAGLMQLRCHLIDALPQPGGQLTEIYPKKPIYDIPGFPSVLAGDLVDNLMEQIAPFKPGFTLGERAETITKDEETGHFEVVTSEGTRHQAAVVIIAGGLGSFEPRKPAVPQLSDFENKGVAYIVRDPEYFRDKNLVISGGGDSALDWAIYFAEGLARSVTLLHRSQQFRGHHDSVAKLYALRDAGKMQVLTHAEVVGLEGNGRLNGVVVEQQETGRLVLPTDYWLPLFGLAPKLGPIADWGLDIDKGAIKVDNTLDYATNIAGIFAVGDVNTYPGKLKLILCGFHEATLAVQSAYKIVNPDKKYTLKYTTVQGVQGF